MKSFSNTRSYMVFLVDNALASTALILALILRVGDDIIQYPIDLLTKHLVVYTLISASCYLIFQLYRGIWRYASIQDAYDILRCVILINALYIPLFFMIKAPILLPRSLLFLNIIVHALVLAGARLVVRLLREKITPRSLFPVNVSSQEVVLVGMNLQTENFVRENARTRRYNILGIVAQEEEHYGRILHGVEVLGSLENLPDILAELKETSKIVPTIIIVDPDLPGDQVRPLMDLATALETDIYRLPRYTDTQSGAWRPTELNPIAIEDLLGRPQKALDRQGITALLHQKTVLVTGAGGSIGSELLRQIVKLEPKSLILVDQSEFLLYNIGREIEELLGPETRVRSYIADVTDRSRIHHVLAQERPHIVFHAAALKHVPIAEANPAPAILINTIGTEIMADACQAKQVETMVVISTDKAIRPTNVMGASKRLAELYCSALNSFKEVNKTTRFITVRFGNVLGSTGSVVPLFQEQIKQGGPITITDPEMQRYFMTIQEAVELVLQAATFGVQESQHSNHIFVLDMGQPIKIVDLARHMIRLAGLEPEKQIPIVFTGRRPGEKLYEELFYDSEVLESTPHPAIHRGQLTSQSYLALKSQLERLESLVRTQEIDQALELLKKLVPEYTPDQKDKVIFMPRPPQALEVISGETVS